MDDFRACANTASMKRGRAETIVAEVMDIVSKWKGYAHDAGVPVATARKIQRTLRLGRFA